MRTPKGVYLCVAIACILLSATPALHAEVAPVCGNDPTCSPNGSDPAYGGLLAARVAIQNARGALSPLAAYVPGPLTVPRLLIGSQSYNRAIPILSLPGRGLDLNLTLYYNSRIWDLDTVNNNITLNADRDFPSYGFRLDFGFIESDPNDAMMILTERDGTKRALEFSATSIYDSHDGTFVEYNSSTNVLTYKNGTMVIYEPLPSSTTLFRPVKIMDTNRNYISISYKTGTGNELHIDTITDTLGRVIKYVYAQNADQKDVLSQIEQLDVDPGTPGIDANGNRVWATFSWSEDTTPVVLKYAFTGLSPVSSVASDTAIDVLTGCTYPNGTSYRFSYGDWGIVNRIDQLGSSTPPAIPETRSYESYDFPPATQALSDAPRYTRMTVSSDGSSTSVWTYGIAESAPGEITSETVTDQLGTATTLTLNNDGTLSSEEIKDSSGKIFRTVDYTWDAVSGSKLVASVATTDDAGNRSSVSYGYDTRGNVTDLKEFDFGNETTPVRETITSYMGTPYTTSHILNLPASIQVRDQSNTVRSRTDFSYDDGTPTALTPFPVQNDGATSTPRGNLTAITRYPDLNDLTNKITRTFTYDMAGNVTVAQLDCCNQKSFTFDPASQYAYLTSVVRGQDNGPQFTTQFSFAPDSGLLESTSDENNQITSIKYDNMYRVIQVTQPPSNGQQVVRTTAYGDMPAAPTVTTSTTANDTEIILTLDGLGHLMRQDAQDVNATEPFSTIQFQYDPIWRRKATSNPYAPDDTVLWSTVGHDALNRVISMTPPSGGSSTSLFSGNTVIVTDAAGKKRKKYYDGLGRLVRVDEPGWGDAIAATDSVSVSSTSSSGGDRSTVQSERYCAVFGFGGRCFDWEFTTFTVYDTGSVSITINNGTPYSYTYGSNDDAASVAQGLAGFINADSNRVVDAAVSGATINLTARTGGTAANGISVTTSSATTDATDFGTGTTSFPIGPASSSLTGGENALSQDQAVLTSTRHLTTTYGYDVFDDMVSISQGAMDHVNGGSFTPQTRSYSYDALERLTSSTSPESGTVTTFYTGTNGLACSGNPSLPCRTTDARNITKTFTYNDPLNRLTGVSFSDGITPSMTYTYDAGGQAAFALGRLTQIEEGGNSQAFSYDNLGRIATVTETIDGVDYPLHYGYNAANQVTSFTYPSGRVVNPGFDTLGRLQRIADAADPTPYLSIKSSDYTAADEISKLTYGNGVEGDFHFNDHLQISTIRYFNPAAAPGTPDVLNLSYDYTSAADPNNNGQIQAIHYFTTPGVEDQSRSESFAYDAWSRLKQAQTFNLTATNTWKLSWGYDQFGNRRSQTLDGGNLPNGIGQPNLSIDPATNRIDGFCYDAAGNLTDEAACPAGNHQYTYDGRNRLTAVHGTEAQYTYFGPLRIKKATGDGTTVYVYSGNKPVAEYAPGAALTSPIREYVYTGSRLLATLAGGAVIYHHPDHLSDRAETDASGNVVRTFGHFPFGETWYETGAADKWKFTTYEHDSETGETGLDYAVFRYFGSWQGRFLSADPLAGTIDDPESLNRYAYVQNDSINFVDPLGLECVTFDNGVVGDDGTGSPCDHMTMGDGSPDAIVYACPPGATCTDAGPGDLAPPSPPSPVGSPGSGGGGGVAPGKKKGKQPTKPKPTKKDSPECEKAKKELQEANDHKWNVGEAEKDSFVPELIGGAALGCVFTLAEGGPLGCVGGAIVGAATGVAVWAGSNAYLQWKADGRVRDAKAAVDRTCH